MPRFLVVVRFGVQQESHPVELPQCDAHIRCRRQHNQSRRHSGRRPFRFRRSQHGPHRRRGRRAKTDPTGRQVLFLMSLGTTLPSSAEEGWRAAPGWCWSKLDFPLISSTFFEDRPGILLLQVEPSSARYSPHYPGGDQLRRSWHTAKLQRLGELVNTTVRRNGAGDENTRPDDVSGDYEMWSFPC